MFEIDPAYAGKFYPLIYVFTFLAAFFFLLREGFRFRLPMLSWLALVSAGFISFTAGCQLITLSAGDWRLFFDEGAIPAGSRRSVLGGILLSVPTVVVGIRLLKLPPRMIDTLGLAALFGLGIQRLGCFLAGCCAGTPTHLPWAVSYTEQSHVFVEQLKQSQVLPGASLSIPVHPVQLYESLGCFVIFFIVLGLRRKIKASGNLLLLSLVFYCALRFLTQLVRINRANVLLGGLDLVQFAVAAICLLSLVVFYFNERRGSENDGSTPLAQPRALVFYFVLVGSLFLVLSRAAWTDLEILAVDIAVGPLVLLLGWKLFSHVTVPSARLATAAFLAGSLLWMGQAAPDNPQKSDDEKNKPHNSVNIGILGGKADLTYIARDCDGNPVSATDLEHVYSALGVGFTRVKPLSPTRNLSYGLNAYAGNHTEKISSAAFTGAQNLTFYGVNPFIQFDARRIGLGGGVHFGDLSKISSIYEGSSYNYSSVRRFLLYPSATLRIGNIQKVFVEMKFANQQPTSFPSQDFSAALGFGLKEGGVIKVGTSQFAGIFLTPTLPLGEHFVVEPWLGMGASFINNYDRQSNITVAIQMQYKLRNRTDK